MATGRSSSGSSGASGATPAGTTQGGSSADATSDIAGASGVAAPAGSAKIKSLPAQKTDEDKAKGGEKSRATTIPSHQPEGRRQLAADEEDEESTENPEADEYIRAGREAQNKRSNGPKEEQPREKKSVGKNK